MVFDRLQIYLLFLSEIFKAGDIAFSIRNLSNLGHNLFPCWNGMPDKCM